MIDKQKPTKEAIGLGRRKKPNCNAGPKKPQPACRGAPDRIVYQCFSG
jgi:hypothetical protein